MLKKTMNFVARKIDEAKQYRMFKRAIWRSIPTLLVIIFGRKRRPRKTKILIYLKDKINSTNPVSIDDLEDDGFTVETRQISEDEVPKDLIVL